MIVNAIIMISAGHYFAVKPVMPARKAVDNVLDFKPILQILDIACKLFKIEIGHVHAPAFRA
jgi:hypothetical protein